jgi:hypothetical protein
VMDFECIKHVQVFLDRCVLLKSVYELLHVTGKINQNSLY